MVIAKVNTEAERVNTFCHVCTKHCAVIAVVQEGRVLDIIPDDNSRLPSDVCPFKKGKINTVELNINPHRLKYPLKRVGERGEGKWERISWDEALDTAANKLLKLKEKYGPESIGFALGQPKATEFGMLQRLASCIQTPNVFTPGSTCGEQRKDAHLWTFGMMAYPQNDPDESHIAKLAVIWGENTIHTMKYDSINRIQKAGGKIIVIDPMNIHTAYYRQEKIVRDATQATLWIKPRPASDGVLVMGFLKVIIEGELYDKDIVKNWTVGFDELKEEMKKFTLDDVERLTWVPKEQIIEAARMIATIKPCTVKLGNALELYGSSCTQALRAMTIIRGICGHLDIPGGDVFSTRQAPTLYPLGRFYLLKLRKDSYEYAAGKDFPWALRCAYTPEQCFHRNVLEGGPHTVRALIICVSNPLLTWPDAKKVHEAMMKLDFILAGELFMSSSACLADIILPTASMHESDNFMYWGGVRATKKIADPPGEAWPDAKWINELAKRMGYEEHFWDDWQEEFDLWLSPSGLTWEQLVEGERVLESEQRKPFREIGWATPSGKIEIYSKQMEDMGFSPMPRWEDIIKPVVNFEPSAEYPLIMTNFKDPVYVSSMMRHLDGLRELSNEPIVHLHPDTAKKYGLTDDAYINIETEAGRIVQKLKVDPLMDPRVVSVMFGWWFPEQQSNLHGWSEANCNVLCPSDPENDDPETGATQLRGVPCRVYPVY